MDMLQTFEIATAVLCGSTLSLGVAAVHYWARRNEANRFLNMTRQRLIEAMDETHKLDKQLKAVAAQRADALAKAKAVHQARKAKRIADEEAATAERRARTIAAMESTPLRPRAEVVAGARRNH